MATLTLKYNARSAQANNLINYVLATGIVTPVVEQSSGLEKAFADIREGRVYHAIRRKNNEKNSYRSPATKTCTQRVS